MTRRGGAVEPAPPRLALRYPRGSRVRGDAETAAPSSHEEAPPFTGGARVREGVPFNVGLPQGFLLCRGMAANIAQITAGIDHSLLTSLRSLGARSVRRLQARGKGLPRVDNSDPATQGRLPQKVSGFSTT